MKPNSSDISIPGYQRVVINLIGCAGIFGEFNDTLTITLEPLRNYGGQFRALTARVPIVAKAYGSPVDFITATKSVEKTIFNDCLELMAMKPEFSEILLASVPSQETSAHLGAVSYLTETKKREVKLRNNSAFSECRAVQMNR